MPDQIAERCHARPAGPDRWRAKCPVHKGKSASSLSIAEGQGGRTLVRCWSGCAVETICAAVGLHVSDLFEQHFEQRLPVSPEVKSVRKVLDDLWPRLTPRERAVMEHVIIRTSPENLDSAIATALALGVEKQEIVQIAMIEGHE
jgi:hypothetical protein